MSGLTLFILFNAIAAPVIGRLVWLGMESFHAAGGTFGAVLLSLAGAFGILGVNLVLTRRAAREGLPKKGVMALALVTLLTFGLTIGTGFFSPVNLVLALARG